MEELSSSKSSRKILNYSENPRTDAPLSDAGDVSRVRVGVSGEHGPKLSEFYGIVVLITIAVATGIFIIWEYVPDFWLLSIGINCRPSRYWALAVPTYIMVTIVLAIGVYIGLNFMATPPPTSLKSIFDEFSKDLLSDTPSTDDDEQAPDPLSDTGINKVNEMLNELK